MNVQDRGHSFGPATRLGLVCYCNGDRGVAEEPSKAAFLPLGLAKSRAKSRCRWMLWPTGSHRLKAWHSKWSLADCPQHIIPCAAEHPKLGQSLTRRLPRPLI